VLASEQARERRHATTTASSAGSGLQLAGVLQHSHLDDPVVAASGRTRRAAHALAARSFSRVRWTLRLAARGDHTGASRVGFDPSLDHATPGAFTLAGLAHLAWGRHELQLIGRHLLDSLADTFAFGLPFSIRSGPQRRRTVTLAADRRRVVAAQERGSPRSCAIIVS
jgi:hypothetical protein